MPPNWNWLKLDSRNILSIVERNAGFYPQFYPVMSLAEYAKFRILNGVAWKSFLNSLNYNKAEAVRELETRFGFKSYPYKHYESVFTRFYQGYILPKKFNIDKRRLHLSALVMSGLVTRDQALLDLNSSPYPSKAALDQDIQFFLNKMKWTPNDLNIYMQRPSVAHTQYANIHKLKKYTGLVRRLIPTQ